MHIHPYLKVVLAAIFMGTSGVFVKKLQMDAEMLSFFRMLVPTIFLGGLFWWRKQPIWRGNLRIMGIASALNALRLWLFMVGYVYTSIANGVLVLYTWPVFTALLSVFFFGERISPLRAVMMALPLAGVALMLQGKPFSWENHDVIGMGAMLISAIIYAYTMIIYKRESGTYTKFETVFFQNVVGGLLFLPIGIGGLPDLSGLQIMGAIAFGLILGVAAFGLFFSGLKHISASNAAYLAYLEVVVSILLGIWVYDEQLTWQMLAGGMLIVGSTLYLRKAAAVAPARNG